MGRSTAVLSEVMAALVKNQFINIRLQWTLRMSLEKTQAVLRSGFQEMDFHQSNVA